MKRTRLHIIFSLLCLMLFISSNAFCQNKIALLVGISEYGSDTGWRNIHGSNDCSIIKDVLTGFDIHELTDSKATHKNIIKELEKVVRKSKKGDIVYLHFSGHGQPVEDENGDEKDGWDEAFIPYDAHFAYEKGVYTGDRHLTDDKMNIYYDKIRKKIGKEGMLYVVMDACHAGGSSRDGDDKEYSYIRGTNKAFSKTGKMYRVPKEVESLYKITQSAQYAPIVILEACQSFQTNAEIAINKTYYGPLSYSIYKTLQNNTIDKSGKWTRLIPTVMKSIVPTNRKQTMVVETSISRL